MASAALREGFMRRALALARQSLELPGTLPYAAVVVQEGEIVGEGLNRSAALHDPTSHGEIEAIRQACRRLGRIDLSGAELYTTGEPCAMCVATMYLTGIARLYYGGTGADTAGFLGDLATRQPIWRRPIGAADLRRQLSLPVGERAMPAEQLLAAEARALLAEFACQHRAG
ncbi:MAG: nucleoside deaminase [Alphaproteobacteria bacterium]|nr:nucleoside deaminase [Alphaproteobacteria bacterium]